MSILKALSPAQRRSLNRTAPLLLVVAGVVLFILGFALTNTEETEPVIFSQNPAIEELIPAPGAEVLRQSLVGIDLEAGFTAELTINGVPIPLDQLNVLRPDDEPAAGGVAALDPPPVNPQGSGTSLLSTSEFLYQPLEGRAVPELKGDENCAVAEFWPVADPERRETVEWCFTVA